MEDVKNYPPYLDYPKPHKAQTNADRIRAMTDEELARFFIGDSPNYCHTGLCLDGETCIGCFLEWLQQPAEPPKEE